MSNMMARVSPWHILIVAVAVAVAAGAVADRGLGGWWNVIGPKQSEISAQSQVVAASPIPEVAPATDAKVADRAPVASPTPTKSLTAVLAERDPRQRTKDLEAFINGLSRSDFADALKRIRRIPGNNERELASRLLVARWVQTDPEAALNFATSNRGFEFIADDVFESEAAVDLQSALNRAKAIPETDMRYMALRGVLSFIAESDPAAAIALAQTLGDFPGNESLASVIYRQWAASDPQSAALQAMQDSAGTNPWQSPLAQVARTWAAQDPMAAANWALSLTDPTAEARTISQVMRQWGRDDLTAAANWVNSLPQGASYDFAAAALAFSMASSNPQDAVSWADNISDATARNNALERVSREVVSRDPTNGAAILEAAGVPANLIPQPGQRGRRGR
jgi:hypothetical protein